VQLAEGLNRIAQTHGREGRSLRADTPQTNIVFVRVDDSIATDFAAHLQAHGIRSTGSVGRYGSGLVQRWVTHLDVGPADVEHALRVVQGFFEARPAN
jgi:threonine aldolase